MRDDVRLLESLCLVGLVPAVARFSQAPWPAGLRLRAAAFVHALCFRRDATLQVGCGIVDRGRVGETKVY